MLNKIMNLYVTDRYNLILHTTSNLKMKQWNYGCIHITLHSDIKHVTSYYASLTPALSVCFS